MAKMTIAQFSKTFNIEKQTLYALTRKLEAPKYMAKDDTGHWQIDSSKAGAKALIKEHGGGAARAETKTEDRKDAVRKAREEKQIQAARLAKIKADQEELKLGGLSEKYIDVETMKYYFTFFQRGITDSYAGIKKISKDLERLYAAGKTKEAEKKISGELYLCFQRAMKMLDDELGKDTK